MVIPLSSACIHLAKEKNDDVYKEIYGKNLVEIIHHIKTREAIHVTFLVTALHIIGNGADGSNLDDD